MSHKKLRTKIIVSLGPASCSAEKVEKLMRQDVYMFRNNFSHMSHAEYREHLELVRRLNKELGTKVLMQVDLQGPHIRIGRVADEGILLHERHTYWFSTLAGSAHEYDIPVDDATIHQFIKAGQPITFLDGSIEGEVVAVEGHRFSVRMISGGTLFSKKAINLPETQLASCLTEKDREDLAFLMQTGVDWIALSFVSRKEEVEEVRRLIGSKPIKLMSKIERKTAVEHLPEIITASDAVMVARGDLGIELPFEEVPFVQKEVINLARYEKKPVVVATQMLYSLTHSLRPTRAEVSDVTSAVIEKADAVLLSDETTIGIDPVNAVEVMRTIIARAERCLYGESNAFEVAEG